MSKIRRKIPTGPEDYDSNGHLTEEACKRINLSPSDKSYVRRKRCELHEAKQMLKSCSSDQDRQKHLKERIDCLQCIIKAVYAFYVERCDSNKKRDARKGDSSGATHRTKERVERFSKKDSSDNDEGSSFTDDDGKAPISSPEEIPEHQHTIFTRKDEINLCCLEARLRSLLAKGFDKISLDERLRKKNAYGKKIAHLRDLRKRSVSAFKKGLTCCYDWKTSSILFEMLVAMEYKLQSQNNADAKQLKASIKSIEAKIKENRREELKEKELATGEMQFSVLDDPTNSDEAFVEKDAIRIKILLKHIEMLKKTYSGEHVRMQVAIRPYKQLIAVLEQKKLAPSKKMSKKERN